MGLKAANVVVQGEHREVKAKSPEQQPVLQQPKMNKRIHSTVIVSKEGKKSNFLRDMLSIDE